MTDPRLSIGANQPPLADRLAVDYEAMRERGLALLARYAPPETFADEAQALEAAAFVRDTRDFAKAVHAARKAEKAPYADAAKLVDQFFSDLSREVGALDYVVRDRLTRYAVNQASRARREAALWETPEPAARDAARLTTAQGKVAASVASRWTYDVIDRAAVPLELMAPSDTAIRNRIAMLRATGAPMAIPGLALREEMNVSVR